MHGSGDNGTGVGNPDNGGEAGIDVREADISGGGWHWWGRLTLVKEARTGVEESDTGVGRPALVVEADTGVGR